MKNRMLMSDEQTRDLRAVTAGLKEIAWSINLSTVLGLCFKLACQLGKMGHLEGGWRRFETPDGVFYQNCQGIVLSRDYLQQLFMRGYVK